MSSEFGKRWVNEDTKRFLYRGGGYLTEGETVESRMKCIALAAEKYLSIDGFAEKFLNYADKGYYSFSTPVWSNFGKKRALPISCYSSYCDDSVEGILDTLAEVSTMSKCGGGTSGYFGDIRPSGSAISAGGTSDGPMSFLRAFDCCIDVFKQNSSRRGSFAAYIPIEHPDIMDFLNIKNEGCLIQNIFPGVSVKDAWLNEMIDGDVKKREVWGKLINSRIKTGTPYIFFYDNVNNGKPKVYKDKNIDITNSNLCSEIYLPVSSTESFVCCLGSMNLLYYDEWKETDAVQTYIYFLDAVLDEFILKTKNMKYMEKAREFAINHRAVGLGVLGWHSLLQSKMMAFESMNAKYLNLEIHELINDKSLEASKDLAELRGEPPMMVGRGERMTTRLSIAPTTSSSFILGQVSQSVEPWRSNYYTKDLAKDKFVCRNKYLEKLIEDRGKNSEDVWDSILLKDGSVQHLEFLSNEERLVFKTFAEIDQREIIIQAGARQKYICQGQSINLMSNQNMSRKDINELTLFAWKSGLNGLYYLHSINMAQELFRQLKSEGCASCEA